MNFELMDEFRFLLSGHKELDGQQMEFINKGNLFLKAYNQRNLSNIIEPTVGFLSDYTRNHFVTQESVMTLYSYPGLDNHKEHHSEYVREIARGYKMLFGYKKNPDLEHYEKLCTHISMMIVDWFEFHILQADQRLNQFLKFEIRNV